MTKNIVGKAQIVCQCLVIILYVCMYVYGELVYRPSLLSDPVIDEIDNK